MEHYPVKTEFDAGKGIMYVTQQWGEDKNDFVEIRLSKDQLLQLAADFLGAAGKKKSDATSGTAEHFDLFWNAYPSKRRVDKQTCIKKWKSLNLDSIHLVVVDALETIKKSEDWTKDGGRYIPMSTTFINQRRWETVEDDTKPWQATII